MMLFQVESVYTKEDFLALAKVNQNKTKTLKASYIISRLSYGFAGALLAFIGFMGLIHFMIAFLQGIIIYSIGYLLLDIGIFFLGIYLISKDSYKKVGKKAWKKYEDKDGRVVYSFYAEYFNLKIDDEEYLLSYDTIQNIYEDKNRFFLFINNLSAHIMNKIDFCHGNSSEFPEFISSRTALEVKCLGNKKHAA